MTKVIKKADAIRYARLGSKVTGSNHVVNNTGCQDALSSWPMSSVPSTTAVMAVADGHGHKKHGRSSIGSYLAVQTATEVLGQYAKHLEKHECDSKIHDFWVNRLPEIIIKKWQRRVLRHFQEQPFQDSEFYELDNDEKAEMEENPLVAYGSTLLTATVTGKWLALLRIGDGVIITCGDSGELSLPFNEEDELDEGTFSLCSRNAKDHFEVKIIPINKNAPAMVLLTTDGYYKDCGEISDFLPFVSKLFKYAQSNSMVSFSETIEASLVHRAKTAPDDLTFGLLVRSDVTKDN